MNENSTTASQTHHGLDQGNDFFKIEHQGQTTEQVSSLNFKLQKAAELEHMVSVHLCLTVRKFILIEIFETFLLFNLINHEKGLI